MNPIAFERLTHYYGGTKALDTLTLEVPPGCVFALLGRNGAGKTTAIKCLLGFLPPTRGPNRRRRPRAHWKGLSAPGGRGPDRRPAQARL